MSEYHCTDDDLGALLHRLFIDEGQDEVEIHHPVDGIVVYTRDSYDETIAHLTKAKDMSPAERLQETKRLARIKQMRFRTAMITAPIYTVDLDDDSKFGIDTHGEKLDIEGMGFIPATAYLSGIQIQANEVGCFVDESMRKQPIRILQKTG